MSPPDGEMPASAGEVPSPDRRTTPDAAGVTAFVSLGVLWGTNFIFTKWAHEAVSVSQIAFLRVVCGFLPVLGLALARRSLQWAHLRSAHHFLVMSLLATSVYYVAYAAGTVRLPSGVAGVLSGTIPLFTFLAAAAFLRSERISAGRVAGLLLGLAGVVLIARPWDATGVIDPIGVLYMLLGSACVGLSFVYAKRFLVPKGIPATALTSYQMGLGVVTLGLITDLHGMAALGDNLRAMLALVVGLGLAGTGVAYLLYYFIAGRLGAVTASSATYIAPGVALLAGWLLAGEQVDLVDAAALILVLVGVLVLQRAGRGRHS